MMEAGAGDVLEIPPDREREISAGLYGFFDDFVGDDQTIDVQRLRRFLATLGPLFAGHAEQFEAIVQTLNDRVVSTRGELAALLGEPLRQLREQSHPDYPAFEHRLRALNQEQNGFVPLASDRMVSYQLDGEFIHLHIQPSYSVADKRGTIEQAMRTLARELETPALRSVTTVGIDSRLVVQRPERWEELGFTIDLDRKGYAYATVSDFRQKWLCPVDEGAAH